MQQILHGVGRHAEVAPHALESIGDATQRMGSEEGVGVPVIRGHLEVHLPGPHHPTAEGSVCRHHVMPDRRHQAEARYRQMHHGPYLEEEADTAMSQTSSGPSFRGTLPRHSSMTRWTSVSMIQVSSLISSRVSPANDRRTVMSGGGWAGSWKDSG